MRKHTGVNKALVVGYEDRRNPENNKYILKLSEKYSWIYPFAYLKPSSKSILKEAHQYERHYFGLSLYVHPPKDKWLKDANVFALFEFIQKNKIPLSINTSWKSIPYFVDLLEKYPETYLIFSHMLAPNFSGNKLDSEYQKNIKKIKKFENVYVKVSGAYAFTRSPHHFPHHDLRSCLKILKSTLGIHRLTFGSDFCPVLEYNTLMQAFGFPASEPNIFNKKESEKLYYLNVEKIIKARIRN